MSVEGKPRVILTQGGMLYSADRAAPVWTAWTGKTGIVHYCMAAPCDGGMANCGTRVKPYWHTGFGFPDEATGRLCLRCARQLAWAMTRQQGHKAYTEWSLGWPWRKPRT